MRASFLVLALGAAGCRASVVDVGLPMANADGGVTSVGSAWTANEANCPAAHPDPELSCDVREGQTCAYWFESPPGQGDFMRCTCYEKNSMSKLWECFILDGVHPSCPTALPSSGQGCFGWVALTCPFPYVDCNCASGADPKWSCGPSGFDHLQPVRNPSPVMQTKRVKDLADAEVQAWCS